jgi:hypothetical protein
MVRRRALLALGTVLIVGVGLRLGLAQRLPITCPLRRLTGIPCASCGLTRAAAALCQGKWAAASAYNLAAIPLALLVVAGLLLLSWEVATQRPVLRPLLARYAALLTWSAVAVMSVAWLVNLYRTFE